MADVEATRVDDLEQAQGVPGAYQFLAAYSDNERIAGMAFICPCGCGIECYCSIRTPDTPVEHPSWEWNGSEDKPTLQPSVFNTGLPCKWHGYLTDGVWRSV